MLSPTLRAGRFRWGVAVAASAVVLVVTTAPSLASTIAYVNSNDGNAYVASSTGTDVHEVATGVSSPSLAHNGKLYALNGNNVDVFAPGTGAQTPIPITGTDPTQLVVSSYGGKLAWTDGSISAPASASVLARSTGKVTTFADAQGPQFFGLLQRLILSENNINNPPAMLSQAVIYNGQSTRALWYPDSGAVANIVSLLQYAPNPAHTEAAALVLPATSSPQFELVVFPIGPSLEPSGNPLATGAFCSVGAGDVTANPAGGLTFAWAPDGSALAYNSNQGIDTASIGAWNSSCSQIGTPQLVIPNGYAPSWGPSNARNFPAP